MAKKTPLNIRLEPEEHEALEAAANAEDRTLSAMARKIIADWLKRKGHLKQKK